MVNFSDCIFSSFPIKRIIINSHSFSSYSLFSRTFSLMHDCGHNSLFEKRYLNNFFGFFWLLNGIPHKPWANDHAFHHRNNGNWEIYKGPVDVLSFKIMGS